MANTSKKILYINGLEYVASKVMTLVNSGGTADYLVEEGTEGIWTYRKWASGIAECWGFQQYSNLSVTRQYGSVYLTAVGSPQAGPDFPFSISNPVVQRTVQGGNQWILSGGDPSTTNSGEFWICRPASATGVSVKVGIYAKGLWKEFTPDIMKTPSLDLYYPVGSIYQTSNANFDPNITFGGTWELITNKFLIGAGDEYENGEEGGSATHTLTAQEMPKHGHDVHIWNGNTSSYTAYNYNANGDSATAATAGAKLKEGYLDWNNSGFSAAGRGWGQITPTSTA